MRILFITQWYPPEPVTLPGELAESLVALGNEVTVLTGFPNYPYGKTYSGYPQRPWLIEMVNGVRVVRAPLYPDHSRSACLRAIHYISFLFSAIIVGLLKCQRPDVIHVMSPPIPVGMAGWTLATLWRRPYTLEIVDMWPETLVATGMLHNQKALALVGRVCDWLHHRAAAIRVITPGFRSNLISKGVSPAKVRVIHCWANTESLKPVSPSLATGRQLGFEGRFTVMFAGTIGLAQGLDVVLDAAALLRDIPNVQFVLVGDGLDTARLRQRAEDEGLGNVRFLGRFPADRMPELYALADVLLVHLRDHPLFRITIPHKVLAYLASGKPILAAVEGDTADLVLCTHAGLSCPSGDPAALAKAVRELAKMSPDARRSMGANGREAACNSYSRHHLVGQVLAMLKDVTQNRAPEGSTATAVTSAERSA